MADISQLLGGVDRKYAYMGAAQKLPENIKIADIARSGAKDIWERATKIAVPIGAVGGFIGDVLAPLGPLVAYLAFGAAILCCVSGVIWYGIKRRQIRRAMTDGKIDAAEYSHIMQTSTWPTVFAFTFVASVVLMMFFGAQKVFAGDEPEKGVSGQFIPLVEKFQKQVLNLQESADRIEKSANRLEKVVSDLNQRLERMDKNSSAIERPSSPEEHYFNARLYELKGEAVKARQSYIEYMKGGLAYLDPHLSLSALMKLQDGTAAAREAYAMFGETPSAVLARSLLMDRPARIMALERLVKDQPEFAPGFYYLSKDYGAPESGQQTLENLKFERSALEKWRLLNDQGLFAKYFIDKRLAISLTAEATIRLRKFEGMSEAYLNARAKMTILPREDGWEGMITVPYDAAEVFVKLPGQREFKSLGLSAQTSGATGKPQPNTSLALKSASAGVVQIKYKDNQGKEFGPFNVEFDPAKEFVALAKKMMPTEPTELAPVTSWKGKRSVTLVQVLMFRAALKNVLIGDSTGKIEHKLKLGPSPKTFVVQDIQPDNALVSQEVPSGWKNVFMRIEYVDGSFGEVLQLN